MPTLPSRIHQLLTRFYGLDTPPIEPFLRAVPDSEREKVLVHASGDAVRVEVRLPKRLTAPGASANLDELCQVVEGVSHFVILAERARRELPTTQLEMELQAEVDKYLVLVGSMRFVSPPSPRQARSRSARIRERLFHRARFAHPAGSEHGDRYRLANSLAARFARRLEARLLSHTPDRLRSVLRRFYDAGQKEKIELAMAP